MKRDQEYRELFAKMDKKRNKIARALKEYAEPDTSVEKKIKLRTFLRQTSIDDPEDKLLLKGAILDPQYRGELRNDMQLALLHAIQDRPEEVDKEYILEVLQRKDVAAGWLMYAMLKMWDRRYIPYLLAGVIAEHRSCTDIEILGRMKVKEAIPFLEVALNDKNGEVRKAAYYALKNITGKKYENKRILDDPAAPKNR